MSNRKPSSRILAALLTLVMVISMVPNFTVAHAATAEHPDAVTLTVKDKEGNPVPEAMVEFRVDLDGKPGIAQESATDAHGVVELLASAEAKGHTVTIGYCNVSRKGFANYSLGKDYAIQSETDNVDAVLTSTTIQGVVIQEVSGLVYNGKPQKLVSVSGTRKGDRVTYELEGVSGREVPQRTDAGTYTVKVTVQRKNFDDLVRKVDVTIQQAQITGISIQPRHPKYNEQEQLLVELQGEFLPQDRVLWQVNQEPAYETRELPAATNAGNYAVTLMVDRGPNYKVLVESADAEIVLGDLNLGGLTIEANDFTYDGTAREAVRVRDQGDYDLWYRLEESAQFVKNTIPQIKDAGTYTVFVKASKPNYADQNYPEYPVNVTVSRADRTFNFKNPKYTVGQASNVEIAGAPPYEGKTFDFSATDGSATGGTVTYSIQTDEGREEIASIDSATGILTVKHPGAITVTARFADEANFNGGEIQHTLVVSAASNSKGELVKFNKKNLSYVLGENKGVISQNKAQKVDIFDFGTITYSIKNAEQLGVQVDEQSGKVSVSDYTKLSDAIRNAKNSLKIEVVANKSEFDLLGYIVYPADSASYTITLSHFKTPEQTYQITETPNQNGWYRTAIHVTAVDSENYTIAYQCKEDGFGQTALVDDEGAEARYVYLRDVKTGGITDRILLKNVKIDTKRPDAQNMYIEYQDLNLVEKIGKLFGFYQKEVKITFVVEDEVDQEESGVEKIVWSYAKDPTATSSILSAKSGEIHAQRKDGKYVASLTLSASEAEQFRGHLTFQAVDYAGCTSDPKVDDRVIVVDDVIPNRVVTHTSVNTNGTSNPNADKSRYFYDGPVQFQFILTEANFFSEDVEVNVIKNNEPPQQAQVQWKSEDEVHTGTMTLSGDGDYLVQMTYKDNSENPMEPYTSEIITIDATPADLSETAVDHEAQTVTFVITEHNFQAQDVSVSGTITDINGKSTGFTAEALTAILRNQDNWTQEGDKYTFTYDFKEGEEYHDGIYNLNLSYMDRAGNPAEAVKLEPLIVDHTKPSNVTITYSQSIVDAALEKLSFGFYKPNVTVTFTAHDEVSGVENFTWNYTRQKDASQINRPTDMLPSVLEAKQDAADKSKFTAEVTLPKESKEQLRGYFAAYATDKTGTQGEKTTDDQKIIVVDTIAPEVNVEYSAPSYATAERAYYKGNVTVTLTVNEANFFAEDVVVRTSKNGGTPTAPSIKWIRDPEDENVYHGIFELKEDGDYVVTASYKDKSTNFDLKKSAYTSHLITIDTAAPEILVNYQNKNVIRTLQDRAGNSREYYADTQTAVIRITEHNFDPNGVAMTIRAEDVSGQALNVDALCSKSGWSTDGDVHTMTITYPGDANYTFDIDCIDAAQNPAEDYKPNYFTVDKTGPVNLTVSYSPSVLDTVLEAISFGFYNAKMTVTISAEDSTSEINSFLYSYMKAAGVSGVNAELLDQTIDTSAIRYSENGRRATASFEIPKAALGTGNQFNGTIQFSAADRSENHSETHKESRRIVVDNIAPTAQIGFNNPANVAGDVAYYSGTIQATVTITEANFHAADVQVLVSKDGGEPTAVTPTWSDSSADVHVGTFTLTEDGDYLVTVNYRDKSQNQMASYTSQKMTIDTKIQPASYRINGVEKTEEGGAYKGEATVAFSFEDQNFDTKTIQLTRTRFNSVEDVTEQFVKVSDTEKGGSGSFTIPSDVDNDGIYVLSIGVTDKALHTAQSQIKFTINRYGSVYEYDDYLVSLIRDGGQYIRMEENSRAAVTKDLVITEYNADRILEDSLKILITRDGQPVDADYTTSPEKIDGQVNIGESGWYQYVYTIKASNFAKDGVYKITLTSAYGADDSEKNESASIPENSVDKNGKQILDTMNFTVDTVAPEIRNVVNLDKPIVNAQTLEVKYTLVDVGGLKSVEVMVNDEPVDTVTEFGDSVFDYSGKFTIQESADAQKVRIRVTDLAGNVTDTASEQFSTENLYVFHDQVIVSTNVFVRWFANKPLFWGSIAGAVVLAGLVVFIIVAKKKK